MMTGPKCVCEREIRSARQGATLVQSSWFCYMAGRITSRRHLLRTIRVWLLMRIKKPCPSLKHMVTNGVN